MNLYYGRGGLNVKRYYIWKANQAELQKEIWTDPRGYYFCNIVTVLPSAQGLGIGKKLFEVITNVADQEGMPCYLESSRDEPNIKIYERMGFHFVKEMECNDDGVICKLFCMIRDPKPAS
jgi:GNAT superfamily N-acetyltransferase